MGDFPTFGRSVRFCRESGCVRGSALPALLVVSTAVADALTLHEPAFYLLIAAVPAAAVSALTALGDLLDGAVSNRLARFRVVLSGLALVWVVVAAAVRSASVDDGALPPAAVSALVACIALFAVQAVATLAAATARPRSQAQGPNGNEAAASRARSITGSTAMNVATVIARHAATVPWRSQSRGGEPPTGARVSSAGERM